MTTGCIIWKRVQTIALLSVLLGFSANILPVPLRPVLTSLPFVNVGVRDMIITLPLDAPDPQVYLSGTPVIAGYEVVDLSASIYQPGAADVVMVLKLDLGRPNLADVIGQIAPFAADALNVIPLLGQEVPVSILFSPKALSNVRLSLDDIRSLVVKQAIIIQAEIPLSSCNGDLLCDILKFLLPGDTILYIDSSIVSTTNFHLIASIRNIDIFNGLTLSRAGIELQVADEITIGIVGQITLANPRLIFTGRMYQTVNGIVLEMIAAGCWYDAFGLPFIDICNIQGSIGFVPGMITELSLGGEVRLGVSSCNSERLLTAIGYIGISANPSNNYFYVSFPQGLTFGNLLRMVCVDISVVPSVITDTGLQPGFLAAYTAAVTGKSIPEINLYIAPGLQVNGTVNILGLQASANISASQSRFYTSIQLPPLNAGGLLQMQASCSDQSRGPYFIADIGSAVQVEACGCVSVLGISASACLVFNDRCMSITIEGRILNIITAGLTLSSCSSGRFSAMEFRVSGHIRTVEFSKLEERIKNAISSTANAASSAVDKAQNLVANRKYTLDVAISALDGARSVLAGAQREFDGAQDEVRRLRDRVNSICHTRSCGGICVPGCGGCRCSWRGCRCRCSSCYSRVRDRVCEAANLACNVLKAPIKESLNLVIGSLGGLSDALGVAQDAFDLAERAANEAHRAFEKAVESLDHVQSLFEEGIRWLDKVASLGLDNILAIKEISLEGSLSQATQGRFSASIKVKILGNAQRLSVTIDVNDLTSSVIDPLADRLGVHHLL